MGKIVHGSVIGTPFFPSTCYMLLINISTSLIQTHGIWYAIMDVVYNYN